MPFSGLRAAARASIALALAALPIASSAMAANAASPQVTLTVHVGYRDTIKIGDWMPVNVDLTNNGSDIDGRLEVELGSNFANGGPPGGTVIYQMPISLGTGATKHVRTFALEDQPSAVTVRLIQNGRVLVSSTGSSGNTTSVLIGVLSDQPDMLSDLAGISPAGLSALVVHLTTDDLTDSGLVLRPFDMLAIDDFATDTLTAAQRASLVDYVMNGGSLLLGTGGSWHKTLGGLPPELVPFAVTGSRTLGPIDALGRASGLEVATGSMAGGAAWLAAGSQPLLIEKAVGQGAVEMATFDWSEEPIAAWDGATPLLRQTFIRSSFGIAGSSAYSTGGQGPFGISVASKGGSIAQSLAMLPALDLPAWWLIGSLVLGYILLVGPINYFVLRALNRRALAWITVPTIALVAAGGAYGGGLLTKGTSVQATQISIVHLSPGSDRAYLESYTGIFTPTRGDYDVGVGGGRTLISAINNYNGGFDPNQGLVRVDTTNDAITLPNMTAFTLRGFATEGIASAPKLVAHATLTGGKLTGTIQNLSSITFTDAIILAGGAYQTFGPLGPGASATFTLTPTANNPLNGQPAYITAYPSMMFGGNPSGDMSSKAQREATAKAAILSTLPVNGWKGIAPAVLPTVVAWTNQPFQDLTVNGGIPRTYVQTGVVLTFPIDQIAVGNLPPGVVSGRIVDIAGDAQPQSGPPGVVVMQQGSVTYEFTPNLASGAHLTGAGVMSGNIFGAKGVVPPNASGALAAVTAQAWDWTQSRWVDLTYYDTSLTEIPDSAVNPSTGAVRLKLSSSGGFTSGWLSLQGQVK